MIKCDVRDEILHFNGVTQRLIGDTNPDFNSNGLSPDLLVLNDTLYGTNVLVRGR